MTMEEVPPITRPRRVAKSVGRGFRTLGRGVREAGAGFLEGSSLRIPRPVISARETGRAAREVFETISQVTFKDEEYFWGDWEKPRKPRKPTSRLPAEVQMAMVSCLGDFHPSIYMSIWHPGMGYPEFIGTLRQNFPGIYEEMKDYAYDSTHPTHPGYEEPEYEEEYPY